MKILKKSFRNPLCECPPSEPLPLSLPAPPVRMLYEFVRTPLISIRILCECPPSGPLPLSLPDSLYECCTNLYEPHWAIDISTNLVRMPPFPAAPPLPPGPPVRMLCEFVRTPLISIRILFKCPASGPLPLSLPALLYECCTNLYEPP